MGLQSTGHRFDVLTMEPDRSLPRGRVVAFPSPAERPPGPTAGQLPEILPTARRLSRASWPPAGRTDEVSDRIAVGVVASGVVLCTIGT